MPISRYDLPAQAEFKSTYVPIPFDEIVGIGERIGARREQGVQAMDQYMATLNDYAVASPDEPEYQERMANIRGEIDDALQNLDPGSFEFRRKISKIMAQQSRDPWWRSARQNYEPYMKAKAALAEAAAGQSPETYYQALKTVKAFEEQGGTSGLMQRTGQGIFTPAGIVPQASIKPAFDEYIDDMKASGYFNQFQDKTGQYMITEDIDSLGLQQLGQPFGINFTKVTNPKTGKEELAVDYDNVNMSSDLINAAEGSAQFKARAQMVSETQGLPYEEVLKQMYVDEAIRSMNEKVFNKSQIKIDADPYALARYKHELEDADIPFEYPIIVGGKKGTIDSFFDLNVAREGIKERKEDINSRRQIFIDRYNIDPRTGVSEDNGKDYSHQLNVFSAELSQERQKQQDINNLEERIKESLGLPIDYKPDQATVEAAREKAKQMAVDQGFHNPEGPTRPDAPINEEDIRQFNKAVEDNFNKALEKVDPNIQSINAALEENAKQNSIVAGATRFTSKSLNDELEANFARYAVDDGGKRLGGGTQGLQYVKDGKDFIDKDYEKLSTEAEFLGYAFDPHSQRMKLVYRPIDKQGNLMDPVWMEAPAGVEEKLIQQGLTSQAQLNIRGQASNILNSVDKEGTIGSGEFAANFRSLYPSEKNIRGGYPNYELELKEKDEETGEVKTNVYEYTSLTDVTNKYYDYLMRAHELNK